MFGLSKRVRALEDLVGQLAQNSASWIGLDSHRDTMAGMAREVSGRLDALEREAAEHIAMVNGLASRLKALEEDRITFPAVTPEFWDQLTQDVAALKSAAKAPASQASLPREILGAITVSSHGNIRLQQQLERDARLMLRGNVNPEQVASHILAGDMA